MSMSPADREVFKQGKPFIVGVVALLLRLTRTAWTDENAFAAAEKFVAEFERRN